MFRAAGGFAPGAKPRLLLFQNAHPSFPPWGTGWQRRWRCKGDRVRRFGCQSRARPLTSRRRPLLWGALQGPGGSGDSGETARGAWDTNSRSGRDSERTRAGNLGTSMRMAKTQPQGKAALGRPPGRFLRALSWPLDPIAWRKRCGFKDRGKTPRKPGPRASWEVNSPLRPRNWEAE